MVAKEMKPGEHQISAAASTLGSVRSKKKSEAVRRNGKRGGRPAMRPVVVCALAWYQSPSQSNAINLGVACENFIRKP